jgi:hypothetical protein
LPRFALPVLSIALLICSAALLLWDYRSSSPDQPEALFSARGAGYLSHDDASIRLLDSSLASGQIAWPAALPLFRATVLRDASSPQRWCEFGEALARTGDLPRAEYAYLRGAALGPNSPAILLDVGDFYFNAGRYRSALPWFAKILTTVRDPSSGYMENVFNYYEGMDVLRKGWLDEAVPDGEASRAWLTHLVAGQEVEPVTELWDWADRHGFTDDESTNRYTDFLIHKLRFDPAAQAWARHYRGRGYECVGPSCVFNGDFEHEPVAGPFDWRFNTTNGIKAERDANTRYEGQHSLRLDFTANDNPDFRQVSERIALQPGAWRLEGYVRTSAITSDEGIRLRLDGWAGPANLHVETPAVLGTETWKRLAVEFQVPEKIHEGEVSIARRKSLRIDNQLSGTAWIDSVRLTKLH